MADAASIKPEISSDLVKFCREFVNLSESENVLKLPDECFWLGQPSVGGRSLYVRDCYRKFISIIDERRGSYRAATQHMAKLEFWAMAIMGTPGIGKTFFWLYLLYRELKAGKSVVRHVALRL